MPKISRSPDARLRWTDLRDAGNERALQAAYFLVSARRSFLVEVAESQNLRVADLEKAATRGEINRIPPVDQPNEASEFPTKWERLAQRLYARVVSEAMGDPSWVEASMNAATEAWSRGVADARAALDRHLQSSGQSPLSDEEFSNFMAEVVTDINEVCTAAFPPLHHETSASEPPSRHSGIANRNAERPKGPDFGL